MGRTPANAALTCRYEAVLGKTPRRLTSAVNGNASTLKQAMHVVDGVSFTFPQVPGVVRCHTGTFGIVTVANTANVKFLLGLKTAVTTYRLAGALEGFCTK